MAVYALAAVSWCTYKEVMQFVVFQFGLAITLARVPVLWRYGTGTAHHHPMARVPTPCANSSGEKEHLLTIS